MSNKPMPPWAFGKGPYRNLQKLSSKRGPPKPYVPPPPPEPEDPLTVDEVIYAVHDMVRNDPTKGIKCVYVHPSDYCTMLKTINQPIFHVPSPMPVSLTHIETIMTAVGRVELRMSSSVKQGSILVVKE